MIRLLSTARRITLVLTTSTLSLSLVAQAQQLQTQDSQPAVVEFIKPCANPQQPMNAEDPVDKLSRVRPRLDPKNPPRQPEYPTTSRRFGEEGVATLRILVNEQGRVSQAQVQRSTGYPLLDQAALNAVRDWRFLPGTRHGKPECVWTLINSTFVLSEYSSDALAQAVVTAEAEELATALLGIAQLTEAPDQELTQEESLLVRTAGKAFLSHPEWSSVRRDIAAMLVIEFTPEEIRELLAFERSATARKFRQTMLRLSHEAATEQRVVWTAYACAMQELDAVLKKAEGSEVFTEGALSPEYAKRVPEDMFSATQYCFCEARAAERKRRGLSLRDADCGTRPSATAVRSNVRQ